MKIQISTQHGVDILTAVETKTARDFQIIKAGIKKLFMSGKNKIVIELPDAKVIDQEAIRELAQFDIMARELSGRITIAGVSTELKSKIELFSAPPVIPIYSTLSEAIESFKAIKAPITSDTATGPLIPKNEISKTEAPKTEKPVTAAPEETKPGLTREQILEREKGDVNGLRRQLAELEKQNKILEEQLFLLANERTHPANETAYKEQIRTLDAERLKFFDEIEQLKGSAKK